VSCSFLLDVGKSPVDESADEGNDDGDDDDDDDGMVR